MPIARTLLTFALIAAPLAAGQAQPDPVAECDRLAASPYDAQRVGEGVALEDLDGPAVVAACRNAMKEQPGVARLQFQLGRGYDAQSQFDLAIDAYQKAGAQGYAPALTAIGALYEGGYGVAQDYAMAADYYRRAMDAGDVIATGNLGYLYHQGLGVDQDYDEAFRLYQQAADQGDAWAENKVGFFYENGLGVTADLRQAAKWYLKSAEQGDFWGQYNTGVMYERGQGVAQDYAAAIRWYRSAADQGNGLASYNLAWLTEEGHGVPADAAEAERLFREALASSDTEAQGLAANALAWRLAERGGDLAEAEQLAHQAVDSVADDNANKPNFLDTLGWVFHKQGRHEEAIAQLKHAIQLSPDVASYHAHMGDVYEALGRIDRARSEWQSALDLDQSNGTDTDWDRSAVEAKLRQTAS